MKSSSQIYGNCAVYHPDGYLMFRCDDKKRNWYLSRNLAVSINEKDIKLTFMPNGPGHKDDIVYVQEKANRCCVCGLEKDLTRHHIVPYSYRKCFPDERKRFSAYDIIPLCEKCHISYEYEGIKLRIILAEMAGVPIGNAGYFLDRDKKRIKTYAGCLLRHGQKIPYNKRCDMEDTIDEFIGHLATKTDLELLDSSEYFHTTDQFRHHAQEVVKLFEGNLQTFIVMWRKHFLETMSPKYMPPNWDMNYCSSQRVTSASQKVT